MNNVRCVLHIFTSTKGIQLTGGIEVGKTEMGRWDN